MREFDCPTVGELLALPVFEGSRLLCGEESLDRPVIGVSLSDIPDYQNWIYPRELLVSTCFAIHNDPAAIAGFIPALHSRGLSGACIKASRFLGEMPPAMLAAAKELHFPLIELPETVRFADITQAVSNERLRRQTALLRRSLSVNQMLTQTITAGATLEEIGDMVREITGGSVLLVDSVNRRQVRSLREEDAARFAALDDLRLNQALMQNAQVHEMEVDGHSFGTLYLYPAQDRPPLDPETLSQILGTIPLEISREYSVRQRENRSFSEFFAHLISDRVMDDQWEQSRADAFHLDLSAPHALLGLHSKLRQDTGSYAAAFQRAAMLQFLRQQLTGMGLDARVMNQGDTDLILLGTGKGSDALERSLARFPALFETLFSDYPALLIAGGCSRPHAGIPGLSLCHWEAQLALKTAQNKGGNCFFPFDRLGILRLLYSGDPHREVGRFVEETLQGLLTQPEPHRQELLETLACYFKNLGNQRRMAQDLYLHYNTVAYRLKRIQELTGRTLRHPEDRMQLELALYLQKFNTV